jgi:hypothetical protein
MGCDIHLHVERRTDVGWEQVPDPESDDWTHPTRWFHDRNYELFAILADVRNSEGDERLQPIVDPRGLPADVSDAVGTSSEEWGIDGHSHSYLTVAEILAFDWDQMATLSGLFRDDGDDGDDPRWINGGRAEWVQNFAGTYHELPPNVGSYCQGVWGPSADKYKRVTWTQPYYRCASDDWWGTVTRAARLSKGSLDDVRLVFWFDN